MAAQLLLQGEAEALTREAVELALGDQTALQLWIDRLIVPHRKRVVPSRCAPSCLAFGQS